MKASKSLKRTKEAHASPSKVGSGDYYGSGIKQKVGIIRDDYLNNPVPAKKMKKPPKSLA